MMKDGKVGRAKKVEESKALGVFCHRWTVMQTEKGVCMCVCSTYSS